MAAKTLVVPVRLAPQMIEFIDLLSARRHKSSRSKLPSRTAFIRQAIHEKIAHMDPELWRWLEQEGFCALCYRKIDEVTLFPMRKKIGKSSRLVCKECNVGNEVAE